MELELLLKLLRKWIWLILLFAGLGGGAAFLLSSRQTPIYRVTATLLITGISNEVASDYRTILAAENLLPTYARQLTNRSVQQETQQRLGLERWTAKVSTSTIANTQLLQLQVEDTDPARAQQIANLMPVVFVEQESSIQQQRLAAAADTLSNQLAEIKTQIDETYLAITELEGAPGPNQAELDRLQNVLYELQASQATFTHSYQEIRLAQVQIFEPVMIREPATLPAGPVRSTTRQDTLLGAAVGTILALAAAFLVEYLDTTVRSPEDLQSVTGQDPICAIPRYPAPGQREALLTFTQARSPTGEAYRLLRTNIRLRTLDNPLRSLLVTSSTPGEGKSYTAANLAVVMAHAETPVLLVDTDLRQPTLHKLFEVPNEQGLTTALLDDFDNVDAHIQQTAVPNLRLLTSGPPPPNPAEILSAQRTEQFFQTLLEQDALLLFDSPPLLAVADASVLANLVDGTLVVVGAGETRPETVRKSLNLLQTIDAAILGTVLTKFRPDSIDGYYYPVYYSQPERPAKGILRWRRK